MTKANQIVDTPSGINMLASLLGMHTNKFEHTKTDIERSGTKIILPSDPKEMSIDEAIVTLKRLKELDETEVAIHEPIKALPLEGAYALMIALQRTYGWVTPQPTKTFFGNKPPQMVSVEINPGQYVQCIWGNVSLPGIEGVITTGVELDGGLPRFIIKGIVKQKYMGQVKRIAELTRQIVSTESIYKFKALRFSVNDEGEIDFMQDVKFIDLTRVNADELVFPKNTMEQIETNLFTPIEKHEQCRKFKVPLNRTVLFEGPYGTGKTLGAYVAAQKAVRNGWTFVYLDRVRGIKQALLFAKQYAPAVIFAEDIDRVVDGTRDEKTDDILNTLDGVDTKGFEILTVLTTNNVENIHQSMLRPGRLDAVISVRAPDAEAVEKLIRIYARGLVDPKVSLKAAGKELAGQIPATIREVVERSKMYAISRLTNDQERIEITDADLVNSAKGMKMHLDLLNKERTTPKTAGDKFVEALKDVTTEATTGALNGTKSMVEEIHNHLM